jgi:flagellar basal body-associated protein FliL
MFLIKKYIMEKLVGEKIKSIEVKQVLEGRPKYFLQIEKLVKFQNLNLQLFLEDTRRNRQVWVDFNALSTNRNAALFLKDHEVEVRDYLNMNVEPVIPQLPIEEEGRQIIKDKVRDELNEFLKNNGIEGKILEIYIDYLMVS